MRNPLNLPAGSVRALLALGLVATCCAAALLKGTVPAELAGLTGSALAFYFGARGAETKEAPRE